MDAIKIVIVGDSGVGKTSILVGYTLNKCQSWDYTPTVYDSYLKVETIDEKDVALCFFDTSGSVRYQKIRIVAYPGADVIIACFSLASWTSFKNVYERWCPEIRQHCPAAPIILVGTKLDIRDTQELDDLHDDTVITYAQGVKMAERIDAVHYVECSSYTYDGLRNVIDEAVRAVRLI